jgi:hypothetical protein
MDSIRLINEEVRRLAAGGKWGKEQTTALFQFVGKLPDALEILPRVAGAYANESAARQRLIRRGVLPPPPNERVDEETQLL